MYPHDNIFQIYYNIGRRLPFLVKRCEQGLARSSSWERMYSNRDRSFLVERIEPKGKYGKAYGKAFVDGEPNNEYRENCYPNITDDEIPCAGCGEWVLVDVPGVDMKEVFPPRGPEYELGFGLHKGQKLGEIYKNDPKYIFWLLETDYWFRIDFRKLLNIPDEVKDVESFVQKEYDKILPKVKVGDTINFGKYKGRTYAEVFKEDPQYIYWVLRNNSTLRFDEDSFRELLNQNHGID